MNAQTTSSTEPRHVELLVAERDSRFRRNHPGLLASAGFAAFLLASVPTLAATAPPLGSTSTYAVVSSTFTNLNNPAPPPNITALNGTAGLPVVCFTTGPGGPGTPLSITGTTVTPCPPVVGVDQGLALANLNAQALAVSCTLIGAGTPMDAVVIPGHLPGFFPPGCYRFLGAINLTANTSATLDGAGVYVFSSVGALNTLADSRVNLINGACESDVFWAPGGATTIGAFTTGGIPAAVPTFVGNIIQTTAITIGHFANFRGRALAFGNTVTTDADTITVPACAPFVAAVSAIPTLSEWAMILLAALLAFAGFAAMRKRAR